MKRRYAIVMTFFLLSLTGLSQDLIIRTIEALENVKVNDMIQSSHGDLLILEPHRLMSFDGYELSLVTEFDEKSGELVSIAQSGNKIVLGTTSGLLFILDKGKVDSLRTPENVSIKKIISCSKSDLLISTEGAGVLKFDADRMELKRLIDSKELNYVNDMLTFEGHSYFGTDQGLYRISDNSDKLFSVEGVDKRIITAIAADDKGNMWLTEFSGTVLYFDTQTALLTSTIIGSNLKVNDIEHIHGRLYLSSNKGLFSVEYSDDRKLRVNQLAEETTTHLLVDDESNLWLGRNDRIECASLYFSMFESPIQSEIHSLALVDDMLYLGSDGGLIKWDYRNEEQFTLDGQVNITCMDREGSKLATGTYDSGVYMYDSKPDDLKVIDKSNGLSDNTVLAIEFIDEGHLIVSTLGGVNRLKHVNGTWRVDSDLGALDRYYILSIHADNSGSIWFGTDKKGVVNYSDAGVNWIDSTMAGQKIGSIASICQSKNGQVWMISDELGLLRFNGEGLEAVASPHGEWDIYTSLVPLESDRFLLIGEKEVSIFDHKEQELIQFNEELELKRGTSFFNNFSIAGNRVIFEHNSALYEFQDDHEKSRTHSLTDLVKVEVDLEVVDTTEHDFSEAQNNFQFTYRGILFRSPKKVRYSYRLIGFDEEWRTTSDRQLAFSHLTPGQYEFQLRSSHDLFHSNEKVVSYSFEIHRMFYNTTWFRTLLLLLLTSFIFWINRKIRKSRELDDKLKILSTETKLLNLKSQLNPHFLFNSFNTVIGLIEEDKERSITFVENLTEFYRAVLEIGDAELIPIASEIDMLRAYIHLMSERFGTGLDVQMPEVWNPSLVPPMSLQLLVENAVKHNIIKENEPLMVVIEETEDTISIKNQFRPRSTVKESMGIGLENLKERYRILAKKEILIENKEGFFKVTLPKIKFDKTD